MNTSKTFRLLSSAAALAAGAATLPAQAQGWQILPIVNDPGYKAEVSLAVTGNFVQPDEGGHVNAWGLDMNMNCGLIQSPDKRIRTHVNFTRSNKGGVQGTGFELSPRYTAPVLNAPGLSLGFGPSIGVFRAEAGGSSNSSTGLGLAAGLNYKSGGLYTGFDLRYHLTDSNGGYGDKALIWGAKVGVNF